MSRRLNVPKHVDLSGPDGIIRTLLGTAFGPTDRDVQVSIGPSGVGDPCDYCVAKLMAGRLTGAPPPDQGSLATWIGTAIHKYLELRLTGESAPKHLEPLKLVAERKVLCGYIEGYGEIYGSTDVYTPLEGGGIIDWKGTKRELIKKYKLHGVPTTYGYQRATYGKGFVDAGEPVSWVANVFIPRDGWRFSDCWWDIQPFNYNDAVDALKRAEIIWNDYVVPGNIEELGSDDDCWNCNMSEYMKLNQEGVVILTNGEGQGTD